MGFQNEIIFWIFFIFSQKNHYVYSNTYGVSSKHFGNNLKCTLREKGGAWLKSDNGGSN